MDWIFWKGNFHWIKFISTALLQRLRSLTPVSVRRPSGRLPRQLTLLPAREYAKYMYTFTSKHNWQGWAVITQSLSTSTESVSSLHFDNALFVINICMLISCKSIRPWHDMCNTQWVLLDIRLILFMGRMSISLLYLCLKMEYNYPFLKYRIRSSRKQRQTLVDRTQFLFSDSSRLHLAAYAYNKSTVLLWIASVHSRWWFRFWYGGNSWYISEIIRHISSYGKIIWCYVTVAYLATEWNLHKHRSLTMLEIYQHRMYNITLEMFQLHLT